MIFVYIRVHSWFWVLFVYFVCFVVQSIRAHSWLLDQFQRKKIKNKPPPMFF